MAHQDCRCAARGGRCSALARGLACAALGLPASGAWLPSSRAMPSGRLQRRSSRRGPGGATGGGQRRRRAAHPTLCCCRCRLGWQRYIAIQQHIKEESIDPAAVLAPACRFYEVRLTGARAGQQHVQAGGGLAHPACSRGCRTQMVARRVQLCWHGRSGPWPCCRWLPACGAPPSSASPLRPPPPAQAKFPEVDEVVMVQASGASPACRGASAAGSGPGQQHSAPRCASPLLTPCPCSLCAPARRSAASRRWARTCPCSSTAASRA